MLCALIKAHNTMLCVHLKRVFGVKPHPRATMPSLSLTENATSMLNIHSTESFHSHGIRDWHYTRNFNEMVVMKKKYLKQTMQKTIQYNKNNYNLRKLCRYSE